MRTGIVIQARTGSSRLPAKILKPLPYGGDTTVLGQVVKRCRASSANDVVVATTTNSVDDAVIPVAERSGAELFRGSEDDVLARYYGAAAASSLDIIVRITADCPCIDPVVIDMMLEEFRRSGRDYMSNTAERTFPHGMDTEIFTFEALDRAYKETERDDYREHVTPYIYKSGAFTTASYRCPDHSLIAPDIRITLDTPEDYNLICTVYDYLGEDFGLKDIVELFNDKPWLRDINASVMQKRVFSDEKEELEEAVKLLERQDMKYSASLLKRELG
ncbi:cytidylyltransferase domain-containing protein [Limisalsivibrio acetivorans]|uniref:cytidylyltransferase domain-containing protein n=1 Tax=Limisalsivibrio acetivorans TaxID=1304888 RepID=UPI0003B70A94|nr:glycosyltransferase family protein [Limisalsivibrio acetivorans]